MVAPDDLKELADICGGARELSEGGKTFIHLLKLRLPPACQPNEVEGLLCLSDHNGYSTRLFLSQQILGRRTDWTAFNILGRTWYTWSWNGVGAQMRASEVLAEHLRALR